MDHKKYMQPSRYVMSLDALDYNLMSTYSARNNDSKSLWSMSTLTSNDYFEFQVKPKADMCNDDESSIDTDTISNHESLQHQSNYLNGPTELYQTEPRANLVLTTCHICDIEVPIAYLPDHENSLKHKAYVKITAIVLNRTGRHMLKKSLKSVQRDDSLYFCGSCVSVIKVDNKKDHEKSKEHKQSETLDRLLNELVALYTGDENYDENITTINKRFADINLKSEVDKNIENNTIIISDIKSQLDKTEMNTGEFIKLIDEYNDDKSYSISSEGNDIKIIMQDCEVVVGMDNFNGFMRMEENFLMCMLCKVVIEDEKVHRVSETHVTNIIKPFKDCHCVRNLDNSSSHCVICNKIVNNFDPHVLCDQTHTDLLEKAIVHNLNKPKHDKTDSTTHNRPENSFDSHVTPNNIVPKRSVKRNEGYEPDKTIDETKPETNATNPLPIEKKPLLNEVTSKDNSANYNGVTVGKDGTYHCNACNIKMHQNNIKSHVIGSKHAMNSKSDLHYVMKLEEGTSELVCRVCNMYIADDAKDVKEHVKTTEHSSKYKEILTANHIVVRNKDFYCKPCDVILLKKNEFYHMEKLTHQDNLDVFKQTPKLTVKESSKNETVSNNSKSPENLGYYCDICNVHIPNNSYNIATHMEGNRHLKNAIKTNSETPESVESSVTISEIHYQMDATDNEKNLMCKICKVIVPSQIIGMYDHIDGKKHIANFKSLLAANNIEHYTEVFLCFHCEYNIPHKDLFKHINLGRHQRFLKASNVAKTDEAVLQTNSTSELDQNNEDVATIYQKFRHHFSEKEGKDTLQCNCCIDIDLEIPNTAADVAKHVATETHLDSYNGLIRSNLILETEEPTYYCIYCDCLVPLKGEIHHIKGQRHEENANRFDKYCDICKVDTAGKPTSLHLLTDDHVTNALKKQTLLHYCEYCDILMQKNNAKDKTKHSNTCPEISLKDKMKRIAESPDSNTICPVPATVLAHPQLGPTENDKNLMCNICKAEVPNLADNITEHVKGKKHNANFNAILHTNDIEYNGVRFFCNHCKCYIQDHDFLSHINQGSHRKLVKNLKSKTTNAPKVDEAIDSQANASTSQFENIAIDVDLAKRIKETVSNAMSELQQNNGIDSSDIELIERATKLLSKLEGNSSNINSSEELDHQTYVKFKHHFIEKDDKEWLQCKVCLDVEIRNKMNDVVNHVTNDLHLKTYKNLISSNLIFETDEPNYYCAICDCLVPLKGEVHHANGLRHLGNYSTFDKHCDICNTNTTDTPFHLISKDHVTRALKKQKLLHYCEYCDTLMQITKAEEHSSNCHKLTVKDKICFCTTCDPYLPGTERK